MGTRNKTSPQDDVERDWPSRKIGYARVSTEDQDLYAQTVLLEKDGCEVIYSDKKSGKNFQRAGWQKALMAARPGDVIVVTALDRASRSIGDLIYLIDDFRKRKIHLRSLTGSIDTTTAGGRLIFHVNAAFAEFQRAMTAERTKLGISARRTSGAKWGARPKLTDKQVALAVEALEKRLRDPAKGRSVVELSRRLGVDPVTLRNAVVRATGGRKLWPPGPHSLPHERAAARRAGIMKPKKKR